LQNKKVLRKSGWLYIIWDYLQYVLIFIILYIVAGHFNFIRVWILLLIMIIHSTILLIVLYKLNPELLNQRGEGQRDSKRWDVVISGLYFIFALYVTLTIAFLDIGRFHWSYISMSFAIVGIVILIFGWIISDWAMVVNVHFEKFVRIQTDRNHKIVDSGPYKYIRHPGYAAGVFWYLSVPVILGSMYAYIPALIGVCFLIIRTYLEDTTLQKELPGYTEYIQKVKYRIIPHIW